jgi:hypothetical protein
VADKWQRGAQKKGKKHRCRKQHAAAAHQTHILLAVCLCFCEGKVMY